MKKLFLFISLIGLFGCSSNNNIKLSDVIDYEIIDTFRVSTNGFNMIMGYELIIKIDSSYYSCYYDEGNITTIYRKLKIKEQ